MTIDPTTLDDDGLKNLIENYRRKMIQDAVFSLALKEQAKRKGGGLNFDATMRVIKRAAREKRFLSYLELAQASGADWGKVHYSVGRHLGDLIEYCHLNEMPLLSAIVVNKPNVKTGEMEPETLKGFVAGARMLKILVTDEKAFLREQQAKVFEWAQSQSDD